MRFIDKVPWLVPFSYFLLFATIVLEELPSVVFIDSLVNICAQKVGEACLFPLHLVSISRKLIAPIFFFDKVEMVH